MAPITVTADMASTSPSPPVGEAVVSFGTALHKAILCRYPLTLALQVSICSI